MLSNNRQLTVAILFTDTIQLIDLEKITSPRAKRSSLIKNQNLIIEERCIKPRSSNGVLQQPIKYSEITKIGFGFTEFSKPYILMQLSPRNHKHHVSKITHKDIMLIFNKKYSLNKKNTFKSKIQKISNWLQNWFRTGWVGSTGYN